jgi:uncharacterized integral membrane protein
MARDEERERSERDRSTTVRLVVGAILVVVLLALIFDNTEKVELGYVFGDVEVAAWVLVLISAALGAAIAKFVSWARRR